MRGRRTEGSLSTMYIASSTVPLWPVAEDRGLSPTHPRRPRPELPNPSEKRRSDIRIADVRCCSLQWLISNHGLMVANRFTDNPLLPGLGADQSTLTVVCMSSIRPGPQPYCSTPLAAGRPLSAIMTIEICRPSGRRGESQCGTWSICSTRIDFSVGSYEASNISGNRSVPSVGKNSILTSASRLPRPVKSPASDI